MDRDLLDRDPQDRDLSWTDNPPPPQQNDTENISENITLPQTSFAGDTNS